MHAWMSHTGRGGRGVAARGIGDQESASRRPWPIVAEGRGPAVQQVSQAESQADQAAADIDDEEAACDDNLEGRPGYQPSAASAIYGRRMI